MSSRKRQQAERFGRWLDITMANRNVSGRALASKTGVNESVVSRWRSGMSTPGMESCARLADALGVDPLRMAVTAGVMSEHMAGVPALPMPPATAYRERVRSQIADIKGLTEQSRQALLETFDETMGESNA